MTPEQITELVTRLRRLSLFYTQVPPEFTLATTQAAAAIECLQASVANAEARYDACEARNEFLTGVIEAIEQAAKEAKELPK